MDRKTIKTCPRCGAENGDTSFCTNCGADLRNIAVQSAGTQNTGVRYCINCGAPLSPGALFCVKCGADNRVASASTSSVFGEAAFCMNCGSPLPPGTAFCMKCGQPAGTVPNRTSPAGTTGSAVRSSIPQTVPSGYVPSVEPAENKGGLGRFLFNLILLAICGALIYIGVKYIPDNIRDARLPEVTVEENDISQDVLDVYYEISQRYDTSWPADEDTGLDEYTIDGSDEDRMTSHWWYDVETEAVQDSAQN